MADLTVDRGSALDLFLWRNHVQAWRIPILVDCGAIKVKRDGVDLPFKKGPKTHVEVDDKVHIDDPLSSACQKSLNSEVNSNARDYAFVPGDSKYDKAMGKLMDARPETIHISTPGIRTLEQFVKLFQRDPLITNPVRKLLVASHANDEGQLKITLTSGSPKFIKYEELEAALKSKSLVLQHEWFLPRPEDDKGQPIPYQLLIRGCRIGTQREFLEKLKEALGKRIQVVAPKHFHSVDPHGTNPVGYKEYMAYNFVVTSPTELKTKDAVVKALVGKHNFINDIPKADAGQPVPEKKFKEWVPEKPQAKYEQKKLFKFKSPIDKKEVKVPSTFRYKARNWLDQPERLAMDKAKTKDSERLDVLKPLLAARPEFKSSHAYPMYKRLGYKTFEDFIKGWTWTFKPKNKAVDEVKFNATRHEYTCIIPIAEPKTNTIVLNFYPLAKKKGKVIENLNLNDPRFFETV
jgi:hypothetical protein